PAARFSAMLERGRVKIPDASPFALQARSSLPPTRPRGMGAVVQGDCGPAMRRPDSACALADIEMHHEIECWRQPKARGGQGARGTRAGAPRTRLIGHSDLPSNACARANTKTPTDCSSGSGICSERAMSQVASANSHWTMAGRDGEFRKSQCMAISFGE